MGRQATLVFVLVAAAAAVAIVGRNVQGRGQGQRFGGVTAEGEALRSRGQYLRGMAWYNFGAARAAAIDVEAQAAWNRAVRAEYARELAERADRRTARKALRDEREQNAANRRAEARRRWREAPTREDIRSGVALDALAEDLADPRIPPARWAAAPVELPPEVTIRALAFRVAGTPRFKTLTARSPGIVAIGRMAGQDWPLSLRRPEISRERSAYRRAVAAAVARCAQGKPLRASDVDAVRDAVLALRATAARVVPADGGRLKQAAAYLDRLDEATRIFLDNDLAEELIRDVEQHRATTVGQLLAFMRKYRLLFAEADDTPESLATYQTLYNLLRWQKAGLDAGGPDAGAAKAAKAAKADR